MKRCLVCETSFDVALTYCPRCQWSPLLIDGFNAYAPNFAEKGGGFNPDYFSELIYLEASNFWFRARNQLIVWFIAKYFKDFSSFLEVGCGTGYVLSGVLSKFPDRAFYGSEIFIKGLHCASKRLPSVKLLQMDARNVPFESEFELIGAFDVIEHIREDDVVLSNFFRAVKPGGGLILTAPQHRWLWSQADECAHHERRYTAEDLHEKLNLAGFEVIRSTSFVSLLLPVMILSRKFISSDGDFDLYGEFKINPILNKMLELVMAFERLIIKSGVNFPLGGSRLILARKPK